MATVKSSWTPITGNAPLNDEPSPGSQDRSAISAYNIGDYFSTWAESSSSAPVQVPGDYDFCGLEITQLLPDSTTTELQFDPGFAALTTVTYTWTSVVSNFFLNDDDTTSDQGSPAIGSLTNGSYFAAWNNSASSAFVKGRVIDDSGTPLASDFQVNSTVSNDQFDSSIAGLNNGNAVVVFTDTSVDAGGDIRARLFDANGTPIDLDFGIITTYHDDSDSDVAALDDGGFVVSWSRNFGGGDLDVRAAIFNADGSVRNPLIQVDTADLLNTNSSSVAGLANGNFVVTWEQEPVGGGSTEVMYRIYDSTGGAVTAATPIDSAGTINEDIQVAALPDGGFVVAYTSNGWGIDGTEITARGFNANGTVHTALLKPNAETTGDQDLPSLTVMSNGYFVVGWSRGSNLYYQAYDPDGHTIGDNFFATGSVIEGEIAALSGGLVANVRSSTILDAGGDDSIRSSIHELTRTTTGDATSETLTGDQLRDNMFGNDGNDTLAGAGNRDTLNGGAGNDSLDGGGGDNTMAGGMGHDTYKVRLGDTVTELAGEGVDTVKTALSTYDLDANFERLLYTGGGPFAGNGNDLDNTITGKSGNDTLNGAAGDDTLNGGAGTDLLNGGAEDDRLSGGDGGDRLNGGTGDDMLTGGAGADKYQFKNALNAATNVDRVTDFSGNDVIHLDDAIFSNIGVVLEPFEFRTGASAADASDRIVYNSATGALFYDADGAGGAAQVRFATLDPGLALTNTDFFMV